MDYVLASSTSSYAHSTASSSFTLSLNTTNNLSASSALSDCKPNTDELSNNAFAIQLKLYRGIASLETKILNKDMDEGGPKESRIVLKEQGKDLLDEDAKVQKWNELIRNYKQ